jgi:hypothetical protein
LDGNSAKLVSSNGLVRSVSLHRVASHGLYPKAADR